jgi:de-etiolated-1
MDGSEKQLNRECSLFCNDGKSVIVGSAILISDDLRPHFYELYTNNEFISTTANCPLEDYTLYIIDMIDGRITDSIEFKNDKIILSHNQGLYLYNDTLAVLSIQHQTIHIYHIIEGTFMNIRSIGRFCCDEEQFLFSSTASLNSSRAFREPTINSLKHRILVYLFRSAKAKHAAGDRVALRKFYQNFDQYLGLRMWKIQLLDEDHLLIKYSSEEVVTLKVHEPNSHVSFFVIYNIWKKKILAVYSNVSESLLYLFENFCDSFRNAKLNAISQWTCSPSNNIYANLLHQRFKQTIISAKGGGTVEATKRINAQLPISSQSYSSSPYLDLSLFSYDDKWVSIMERPKAASEFPIRFFARDSGLLRFKIHSSQKSGLTGRRLVAFCFHPFQPFAISVQRIDTNYIVNFHMHHNAS